MFNHQEDYSNLFLLDTLILDNTSLYSIVRVKFPESITILHMSGCDLEALHYAQWPPQLKELDASLNHITSLNGVVFPKSLKNLDLSHNDILSLKGAHFHLQLKKCDLSYNAITTLADITLLCEDLDLQGNKISCVTGFKVGDNSE